ncbi:MAG: YcxB family protein [Novosphingobium sp.]
MNAAGAGGSFSFEPTAQDNAQAAALLAGRHPMRKAGPLLVIVASLLVGGLVALASTKFAPHGDARRIFGLAAAMCALFLGFQYLMLLRIALNTTRASIESLGWTGRRIDAVIVDGGMSFDGGQMRLEWHDLRQATEGPAHIVLLSNTLAPIVIPKRALSEETQILLLRPQVRA